MPVPAGAKVYGEYVECPVCMRLQTARLMVDEVGQLTVLTIAYKVREAGAAVFSWFREPAPRHILLKIREVLVARIVAIDNLLTRSP